MVNIFFRIKDKINNPPEKRDHQKVSHSLARFIKLKEAAKKHAPKQSIEPKRVRRATNENEDKPGTFIYPFEVYLISMGFDHLLSFYFRMQT